MTSFVLRGPLACFSRPECPDRFTYPIPTPSALQDIVSAIYGHPGIGADVRRICVLSPIRYVQMGHVHAGNFADGGARPERAQLRRTTVETMLADPAWLIDFEWRSEPNLGKWRTDVAPLDAKKADAIFCRRLSRGEFYRMPSLGLHQLRAIVHLPQGDERPIRQSRDFGMVLHGLDYRHKPPVPEVFHAKMVDGVIEVPSWHDRIYGRRGRRAA